MQCFAEMTVGDILSLALAMGSLAILVELVVSFDRITFCRYLVLAQGQLRSLIRWGHTLHLHDKQYYTASLRRMRASLQH